MSASVCSFPARFRKLVVSALHGALWLGCASLVTGLPARAQTAGGSVEGRVTSLASGEYLGHVSIGVKGTDLFVKTDADGYYRIAGVATGKITVVANYPGLESAEATIDVPTGQTVRQNFSLKLPARADDGVVKLETYTVAATREIDAAVIALNEQRFSANAVKIVAADAFGSVNEGNVGEFMKYLPGVNVVYAAQRASEISLRGLPSSYTPIEFDGQRVASDSYGNASRTQITETMSTSNLARIEVVKVVTPSMSADSLGGAVNLVTKNAFERDRPEFVAQAFLAWESHALSLQKEPGNGHDVSTRPSHQTRPGFQFSYLHPFSRKLGIAVSGLTNYQVSRLVAGVAGWERVAANGGSEASPFLRSVGTNYDPNIALTEGFTTRVDWRPIDPLTVTLAFRWNHYDLVDFAKRLNFNTGTLPAAYGPTFTQGRAGVGSVAHNVQFNRKEQVTRAVPVTVKWVRDGWDVKFAGSVSRATTDYRDTSEGFFNSISDGILRPTVRLDGPNGVRKPTSVLVTDSVGNPVDYALTSSYIINSATAIPRGGADEVTSVGLDVRRNLSLLGHPVALKVGSSSRKQQNERWRDTQTYTFVGADRVAGTADDNMAVITDDNYLGISQRNGWGTRFQWPDLRKLWTLYQRNPTYMTLNQVTSYIARVSNDELVKERIDTGYVQVEAKFWRDRLNVIGGVRYEKTKDDAIGLKRDNNAIYRRGPTGNLVLDSSNRPVPITTDPLEQARLQYIARGAKASVSYSDLFPSLSATLDLSENLLLRLGYAYTMGRPNFNNIIPNYSYDELTPSDSGAPQTGVVTLRNPGLKPFFSDNFEAGLEYYFGKGGAVTIGVFRKNLTGAFGTSRRIITSGLLGDLGLPNEFLNWTAVAPFNATGGTRVTGAELSVQYSFRELPRWFGVVTVFASGTALNVSGDTQNIDQNALAKRTASFGLSYYRGPWTARVNGAYTGNANVISQTFAPGASRWDDARLIVDGSLEYQLSKHFAIFLNAYNLTDEVLYDRRFRSANTPEYSSLNNQTYFPMKGTLGIKASF